MLYSRVPGCLWYHSSSRQHYILSGTRVPTVWHHSSTVVGSMLYSRVPGCLWYHSSSRQHYILSGTRVPTVWHHSSTVVGSMLYSRVPGYLWYPTSSTEYAILSSTRAPTLSALQRQPALLRTLRTHHTNPIGPKRSHRSTMAGTRHYRGRTSFAVY